MRNNEIRKELVRVRLYRKFERFILDYMDEFKDMQDAHYSIDWFRYDNKFYNKINYSDILYGLQGCLLLIRGKDSTYLDYDKMYFFYKYIDDHLDIMMKYYCEDVIMYGKKGGTDKIKVYMILWLIISNFINETRFKITNELANIKDEEEE